MMKTKKICVLLFMAVLVIAGILGMVCGADARSNYPGIYNGYFRTTPSCSLCHTSPPSLNATGTAFLNAGGNNVAGWNSIKPADTTPPTVTITTPATNPYSASSSSLSIAGTASDNFTGPFGVTQISWSNSLGGSGTATGTTSWSASGITLASGQNIITVTARDAAGNVRSAALTVTLTPPPPPPPPSDTTAPTATISTPTSSPTYSSSASSLSIGGSASDNVGVTQVSWSNNQGGSGTCTGTTSWSAGSITLASGQNIITVTARDGAGNVGSDTLTVTYTPSLPPPPPPPPPTSDTTPPTVTISSPTGSQTYSTSTSPLSIGGSASDSGGVTQVSWSNNRGGSGTCTGTTSWNVGGITLASGQNIITVTAQDGAGNVGSVALTVTYTPSLQPPPLNQSFVPNDFDGDGKADIVIWRPENGYWYIIHSSDQSVAIVSWGGEGDIPVSGDYDGDGKADIAVWRPSNGYWYIINSSDQTVTYVQWGVEDDIPVPGDYDGDGKTDIAVWRPGNGYWYILHSSDGNTAYIKWGIGMGYFSDIPVTP